MILRLVPVAAESKAIRVDTAAGVDEIPDVNGPEATRWNERAAAAGSMLGALSERDREERRPEDVEGRRESMRGESDERGEGCSDDDVGGLDLDEPFDMRTHSPAALRSYAKESSKMESSDSAGDGWDCEELLSADVTVGVRGGGVRGGETRGNGTDSYVVDTDIIATKATSRGTKTRNDSDLQSERVEHGFDKRTQVALFNYTRRRRAHV